MANMSEHFHNFSSDDENFSLEELVALIQQAPDGWFEDDQPPTRPSAEELITRGHEELKAYQSNPSPEALNKAIAHYKQAVELNPKLAEGYTHLARALWQQGSISLENTLHYCELAIQNEPDNPLHYLTTTHFLAEAAEYQHIHRVIGLAELTAKTCHQHGLLATIHWAGLGYGLKGVHYAITKNEPITVFNHHVAATFRHSVLALSTLPYQWANYGLQSPPAANTTQAAATATVLPFAKPGHTIGEEITPTPTTEDTNEPTTPTPAAPSSLKALFSGMVTHLATLVPNTQHQQALLHWAHKQHPEHRPTLEKLAHCYHTNGSTTDAKACFEHLSLLYPNCAEYHAQYGLLLAKQSHYPMAIDELQQALSIQPGKFEWLFELGQLQIDAQEYLAALVSLKEAKKQHPHHPLILSNMAYVLFKLNDMEGAITCYEEALIHGTDPQWKSAVAQTLGALLYQFEEDMDAAFDAFSLALKLDINNTDARTMMAELLFELGDFEEALSHYETLHTQDPLNVDTLSHMGYILWQMDSNDEAVAVYKAALAIDSENAVIYNNMGVVVLDELMDGQQSAPMFENALKYNPNYTLAAFNLGRALELIGNRQEAANAYGNALNLHDLNPEMDKVDIEDRLHNLFRV